MNKPLIAWSVIEAKKSKLIDKIILSTDSKKYANIANKYGVDDILMRPKNISKDKSTDYEFIKHSITNINYDYDIIAHLRPTTPLREYSMIDKIIAYFKKNKEYSSLRTVHQEPETSYKSFEIHKNLLKPLKNLNTSIDFLNNPRQKFNKTYSANGYLDLYRKSFIVRNKKLFGKRVRAYEIDYSPEIDNKEQINIVEYYASKKPKYKFKN